MGNLGRPRARCAKGRGGDVAERAGNNIRKPEASISPCMILMNVSKMVVNEGCMASLERDAVGETMYLGQLSASGTNGYVVLMCRVTRDCGLPYHLEI